MHSSLVLSIVSAVLFFVLSPGVLLTIPPTASCSLINVPFMRDAQCVVNYTALLVHSAVYGVIVYCFLKCGLKMK